MLDRTNLERLIVLAADRSGFVRQRLERLRDLYRRLRPDPEYAEWAQRNEQLCFVTQVLTGPLMSVVVAADEPPEEHLLAMVYSVINQHYENWELLLVNGAADSSARARIDACREIDTRITLIESHKSGIARDINSALARARGDFITLVEQDAVLHPCALHSVVHALAKQTADFVYTDEDKINHDGRAHLDPFFKPSWSPALFHSVNYIDHLVVVRKRVVETMGGLRPEFEGAQNHDFLLRAIDEHDPKIVHVPRVLYHRRAGQAAAAATAAGVRALQSHRDRNRLQGRVETVPKRTDCYQLRYQDAPAASVVIAPVDPPYRSSCAAWLLDLAALTHPSTQLIIGHWYAQYDTAFTHVSCIDAGSAYFERATLACIHEAVVVFQIAAVPKARGALEQLAAAAVDTGRCQRPTFVSPVLLDPRDRIADAGLWASEEGYSKLFNLIPFGASTPLGSTAWNRNVPGLTMTLFACQSARARALTEGQHDRLGPRHGDEDYVVLAQVPFIRAGALQDRAYDQTLSNPSGEWTTGEFKPKNGSWMDHYERIRG